jgi:hypothetical protein
MGYTLKPAAGVDLSRNPQWARPEPAVKAAPSRPTTPKSGEISYIECCPDDLPDRLVRVSAAAAAHIAARELGMEPPAIKWFQRSTAGQVAYTQKYYPRLSLKQWMAPVGLLGQADRMPTLVNGKLGVIWLNAGQTPAEARSTARHEVCHLGQMMVGLALDEEQADRFSEVAA